MSRVVVIGGGVIGLMAAWRAAQAGAAVTVLDPTPGTGASWVAAGMLAPVTEAHLGEEPLLALNRHAATRWPDVADELVAASGRPVDLRRHGTVVAARDADDMAHLDDLADRLDHLGLEVERLRARALRRREPALDPGVRGGLDVAGDHAVDNRQVVTALLAATVARDVEVREVAATGVRAAGGAVREVRLADGTALPCDRVVVAAGAWSSRLELPVPVPVRPVHGEVLRLRDDATTPLLGRTVRGRAHGRSVYLVPRSSGEVVVGATTSDRGHDPTVTAGGVLDLLTAARDLVPGVRELALVESRAGLRPGTPDNAPLVGPTDVEGLFLATGHHRHGILQSPLVGDAVTAWLQGSVVPDVFTAADPRRFTPCGST